MLKLSAGPAHRELCSAFPRLFSLTRGVPVKARARRKPGFAIVQGARGLVVLHQAASEWFRALGELARNATLTTLEVVPRPSA
ncbi:MAG TPA: hypothetical protein VIK01_13060 [Polyangiaceae bacterium]